MDQILIEALRIIAARFQPARDEARELLADGNNRSVMMWLRKMGPTVLKEPTLTATEHSQLLAAIGQAKTTDLRGRPSSRDRRIEIRLPQSLIERIDAAAATAGTTRVKIIKTIITQHF